MMSCDVSFYQLLKNTVNTCFETWTSSIVLLVHQGGHIGFVNDNVTLNDNYLQILTHNCQKLMYNFKSNHDRSKQKVIMTSKWPIWVKKGGHFESQNGLPVEFIDKMATAIFFVIDF